MRGPLACLAIAVSCGILGALPAAVLAAQPAAVVRTLGKLQPPDVALVTHSGAPTRLSRELAVDEPLIVTFVFTSCSSTCSLQTAVLADLQRRLAAAGQPVRLLSVTIDPDNDTPDQLARYARTFEVGAGWNFCTGTFDDMLRVQQSFDVYRGSKASHPPVILMRRNRTAPWVRIEGFPTSAELAAQLRALPTT